MDPIKVDFANKKGGANKKEIVIPPEKAALKIILSIIGMLVFAAVAFYVMLPALNFKDYEFYLYIGMVAASYVVFNGILSNVMGKPEYIPYVKRRAIVPGIIIAVLVVTVGIGYLVSCEFFRAKAYHNIIDVEPKVFTEEIREENISSFTDIPKLDDISATELANKALGELAEKGYVSQFTASTESTQINYNGVPVRVAPLKYASIIKWLNNTKEGLPGYVRINMADEKTTFEEATIKYSTEEYFNEKLERYLRFKYPTYIFGDANFEIDEAGKPYWICPVLDRTIGLFGGTDVKSVIIVNAEIGVNPEEDKLTGEFTMEQVRNNEELKWIDRAYDSDLLIQQYNFYGKYPHGFWNSILAQNDVITSTQGYNYIAKDDDVWMYTGVTSVTSDSSITGFVLINQRTKEAQYYPVTGGTEAAAQEAAQGRVKQYNYVATFPLIVNIDGQATYFMSLKDATNIRQQYALIHVNQYNKIGATSTDLNTCLQNYRNELKANGIAVKEEQVPSTETPDTPALDGTPVTGAIADIRDADFDGNTVYFIKLEGVDNYFEIPASKDKTVVILNKGDNVTITYSGEGEFISADSIKVN